MLRFFVYPSLTFKTFFEGATPLLFRWQPFIKWERIFVLDYSQLPWPCPLQLGIKGDRTKAFENARLVRFLRWIADMQTAETENCVAFLLRHYSFTSAFIQPLLTNLQLFKAAILFGFFGYVSI